MIQKDRIVLEGPMTHDVAEAGHEHLPLATKCLDYRYVPPCRIPLAVSKYKIHWTYSSNLTEILYASTNFSPDLYEWFQDVNINQFLETFSQLQHATVLRRCSQLCSFTP